MATVIAELVSKFTADVSDLTKNFDDVDKKLNTLEKGMNGLQTAVGGALKVAAGVGAVAIGGLATGIGVAVKSAADMEQGIANIAAAMQLGAEDTENLKGLITDLGLDPNLKVTAVEAAQAIEILGTAGLTLDEIMGGAARSTVLLANSTGADFAQAGAIASDVMAQFNIEAADMANVVDQITGVTVASKFDINDYALALSQAGGVAGSVGVDFDDFNAVIAAISPNFSSGSDAGTSFKTMLQTLIPKSQEAEDKMKELGIVTTNYGEMAEYLSGVLGRQVEPSFMAVEEAFSQTQAGMDLAAISQDKLAKGFNALKSQFSENQFFDENTGEMKSMAEIAGILQTAFGDLSEQQRIEAASTIFGTDAMRAAFGLIDAGTPGIIEMKNIIGDTSAEESAATRMDTLTGAWEIFTGVVETLTLGIGDKFLPVARKLVEWTTSVAQTYGPALIEWFGEFAEQVATGVDWLIKIVETGDIFNETFAALPQPIQNIITGIVDLTKGIQAFLTPIAEAIGKVVSWQDVLAAIALVVTSIVVPAIWGFIAAATPIITTFAAIVAACAALRIAWEDDWLGIRTAIEFAWEIISGVFNSVAIKVAWIVDTFQTQWKILTDENASLGDKLQLIWNMIGDVAATVWQGIVTTVQILWPKFRDAVTEWAVAAWQWIVDTTPVALNKMGEWGKALWGWVSGNLPLWIDELAGWAVAAWQWIVEATSSAVSKLGEWGTQLWNWLATNLPTWINKLSEWANAAWQWIVTATTAALGKLGEWGGALLGWLGENLPNWIATIFEWATALVVWITDAIPGAINNLANFVKGLREEGEGNGLSSFLAMAGKWALALWRWIVDELIPAVGPAYMDFMAAMANYGLQLLGALGNLAVQLGITLWQWIVDVTPTAVQKLGEWGAALWGWIQDNMPSWVAKLALWATAAWQWIVDASGPALQKLGEWGSALWSWVQSNAPSWVEKLAAWGKAAWEWIAAAAPVALQKLGEWGSGLWEWVKANAPTWKEKLGEWAAAAWKWITETAIPEAKTQLGNWGAALWNWIQDNAPVWKQKLGAWAEAAWRWITDTAIPTARTKMGEWGDMLKQWVSDKVSEFVTKFKDFGRDIIDGLRAGISEKWESLKTWFSGVWGGLVDKFKSFFGIASPSTLFKEFGKNLMQGLEEGIEANATIVTKAVDTLAASVSTQVSGIAAAVGNSLASATPQLDNYYKKLLDAKIAALELASMPTIVTPVAPPNTAPPVLTDPNAGGGGMGMVIPKTPVAGNDEFGLKGLDQALINLPAYNDVTNTLSEIQRFAVEAMGAISSTGQQVQGSSAEYLAYKSLTSGGLDKVSVNNILMAIQNLIAAMERRGVGQSFNLTLAPDAQEQQRIELEQLVSYLNALYG